MMTNICEKTDFLISDDDPLGGSGSWFRRKERHAKTTIVGIIINVGWNDLTPDQKTLVTAVAPVEKPLIRNDYTNKPKAPLDVLSDEIVSLTRLDPNWMGQNSVIPKQRVIDDFQYVLPVLPLNISFPDIEIEDEGGVSLEWTSKDKKRRFTLSCRGTGNVVGTLVSMNNEDQQAWREKVTDTGNVARRLSNAIVEGLMTGRQ